MDFETQNVDNILLVKPLEKRIDASTSTAFKAGITDFILKGDKFLLLNFDKVEFVDSSGLGSLISILKTLASTKGNMALCRVNSSIFNLFSVTRMDKIFFIAKSESEAKDFLEDWRKKKWMNIWVRKR